MEAGLVTQERQGRTLVSRADVKAGKALVRFMMAEFGAGDGGEAIAAGKMPATPSPEPAAPRTNASGPIGGGSAARGRRTSSGRVGRTR